MRSPTHGFDITATEVGSFVFLTQEKLIKKIEQDRQRGDLKRAQKRALDGLEKWPDDYSRG